MILQKNNKYSGISGVVRSIRMAPNFFPTTFKAVNSDKYYYKLLTEIGQALESGDEKDWPFYLLVLIEIDSFIASSVARMIVERSASDWLRALAYSYFIDRRINGTTLHITT